MKQVKSVKFSTDTIEVIEELNKTHTPKQNFNYQVEHLVETNPEFIAQKKKKKMKYKK